MYGPVVQWIEHHRPKVGVGGSTPSRVTRIEPQFIWGFTLVRPIALPQFGH